MSEKILKAEEPDLSGTYTAKDYLTWQLDELVELIRGKIYKMSPSPTSNHQRISLRLGGAFLNFFENKKCEVFVAPFDVYLVKPGQDYKEAKNIVEPDLCVICDTSKIKKFGSLEDLESFKIMIFILKMKLLWRFKAMQDVGIPNILFCQCVMELPI